MKRSSRFLPGVEQLESRDLFATYTVTTVGDAMSNAVFIRRDHYEVATLRGAITEANANPGPDVIDFNIRIPGTGTQIRGARIFVFSALPTITGQVTILGTTQRDLVGIDGAGIAGAATGLEFTSSKNSIIGLWITRFQGSAVAFRGTPGVVGSNRISSCFLGTSPQGTPGLGNFVGIEIHGSSQNDIGGTVAVDASDHSPPQRHFW